MDEQIIAIFCICDEIIKSFGLSLDPQQKMNDAEVMTFALISALYYSADYRTTRLVSISLRHFPSISLVFMLNLARNRIETVFSSIISRMPRNIRARTEKGFYLKILFFILAYLINRLSTV